MASSSASTSGSDPGHALAEADLDGKVVAEGGDAVHGDSVGLVGSRGGRGRVGGGHPQDGALPGAASRAAVARSSSSTGSSPAAWWGSDATGPTP